MISSLNLNGYVGNVAAPLMDSTLPQSHAAGTNTSVLLAGPGAALGHHGPGRK
jgi:hypothetical protein